MNDFLKRLNGYVDRAVEKVDLLKKSDSLIFPIFTDLHTMDLNHEYAQKLIASLKLITDRIQCNAVINLGDTFAMLGRMIQISNEELKGRFVELYTAINEATRLPLVNVNGNHDAIGTDFFKPDFWNNIVKGKFGNTDAVYSNEGSYYYLDIDTTRFVVLSLPCESDLEADNPTPVWQFGEKQLEWLKSVALDTDKSVIILSHVPFFYSKYYGDPEAMLDVWNGSEVRKSYISALCGWIDDIDEASDIVNSFAQKGKLVACLSGHTHADSLWDPFKSEGNYTNPLSCRQAVTTGVFWNNYSEFVIDVAVWTPSENKLSLVRVGVGEDREIRIGE